MPASNFDGAASPRFFTDRSGGGRDSNPIVLCLESRVIERRLNSADKVLHSVWRSCCSQCCLFRSKLGLWSAVPRQEIHAGYCRCQRHLYWFASCSVRFEPCSKAYLRFQPRSTLALVAWLAWYAFPYLG